MLGVILEVLNINLYISYGSFHLCETFDILVSPTGAFEVETPATNTVSPVDETTCKRRSLTMSAKFHALPSVPAKQIVSSFHLRYLITA